MLQAIKQRTSIRSYEKKGLSKEDLNQVLAILNNMEKEAGPFGHFARFFYTENKKDKGGAYGTYGFIKNPPAFIGGVINNSKEAMVDFGFLFEEIILKLTKLNIGTVWLGGTFNRQEFNVEMDEKEIIAAISPVGYQKNRSIREKVIRNFIKADKRIDFNQLFFKGKNLDPIPEDHPYYKYLQSVQVAPSASNKQPWRIVLLDNTFHFYLKRNEGYASQLKFDIQSIDIGIALAHLYLTLNEDNILTTFIKDKLLDIEGFEYVISIKIT